VKFWIGLALVLVLMMGTLYVFVIRPSMGGPETSSGFITTGPTAACIPATSNSADDTCLNP
jgi:hypothetical protein